MVVWWCRAHAHEFHSADLNDRDARVVVEMGDDVFRHGNSYDAAPRRHMLRGTIARANRNA